MMIFGGPGGILTPDLNVMSIWLWNRLSYRPETSWLPVRGSDTPTLYAKVLDGVPRTR